MNAPVTRRTLLSASVVAVGATALPIGASALARPWPPDTDLFRLLDAWGPARSATDAAAWIASGLWEAFLEQEPERPVALRFGGDDGLNCGYATETLRDGRWVALYDVAAIEKLRSMPLPTYSVWEGEPAPWNPDEQVGRFISVPAERAIARRAEVIAAHDAWWAECQVVKDRLGIPAADDAEEAAAEALHEIEAAILATIPTTFASLAAKARWATGPRMGHLDRATCSAQIAADVVAMAEHGGVAT